jgi:hypothetical protein
MGHQSYTADEIVERGKAIYENDLKNRLESQNFGKFLVIDIESGEYEIDEDDIAASRRAMKKNPAGIRFGMRIGYATSGTIGNSMMSAVP